MKNYFRKVTVRPASAFVDAAQLKRRIPPLDFYRRELEALPSSENARGWVCGGLCAFHPDKRAGSFRVNLDTGGFKCFSCGASGGDIIDFIRLQRGHTFTDALDVLENEWGLRA